MKQKDCIFLHLAVYRKHFRCKKPNPLRVEHKILREKLKREEATTIFTPFAFQWRDVPSWAPSKGTMSTRKCFYSHRVCVSLHWRASTCKSQGGERIVGVGWGGVRGRVMGELTFCCHLFAAAPINGYNRRWTAA